MIITTETKAKIFASAQRMKCLTQVMMFEELEKMPKAFQSQANKNHLKKIANSLEQIKINTGTLIKTKHQDNVDDYTYLLWRAFDKLIGLEEEQLEEVVKALESNIKQAA